MQTNRPAIVICNPVGFELIRTHRTVRTLAAQLAERGHWVLRFDYRSTGDSAGDERDSQRLEEMLRSTRDAMAAVCKFAGTDQVSLIGLRLGANLAAKIAEESAVAQLVLWAPYESGAMYIREQQIMASAQSKRLLHLQTDSEAIEGLNAGGFFLSKGTQKEFQLLTIGVQDFCSTPNVLLLHRDDLPVPLKLADSIRNCGSAVIEIQSVNYKDMMLTPQISTVPADTIARICDWIDKEDMTKRNLEERLQVSHGSCLPARSVEVLIDDGGRERPIKFGPHDRLFGIITTANKHREIDAPAVILLCGGATHRISANRMYVALARRLAANGVHVMRMDLAGIGDSLPHDGYPPNQPYTDKLADDVEAAMNTLEAITGKQNFLLFGLCSGAYAAMQTALRSARVSDLVLVNQLVYYVSANYHNRLFSGMKTSARELDFPRSDTFLYRLARRLLRRVSPHWNLPGELLSTYLLGGNLRRDLDALVTRGTRLAFVQSSCSAAADALSISAGKWIHNLTKTGKASVTTFEGCDHTFSPTASQRALMDWLETHVTSLATTKGLRC